MEKIMALKAEKKKQARIKCVVAGLPGTGVMIDHKNCLRGQEVTPEDVGMTTLMLAEGQLVKADSDEADRIKKAVKAEAKAASE